MVHHTSTSPQAASLGNSLLAIAYVKRFLLLYLTMYYAAFRRLSFANISILTDGCQLPLICNSCSDIIVCSGKS
jgi:hypothetical protein